MLINMIKFGFQKGIRYKANFYSWILADISLYFSLFLVYIVLFTNDEIVEGFCKKEMLMYISTYCLVNNIYAIFFSEASSTYADSIKNGSYCYYQLIPISIVKSLILQNFNFPAFISTPILVGVNVYLIGINGIHSASRFFMYYCMIICAVFIMFFLFLSINSLLFFRIRSGSLGSGIMQLFAIAEKPDVMFNKVFRNFFTYCIPAFMFSAVPTRFLLNKGAMIEIISMIGFPIEFYLVYRGITYFGKKKYVPEEE